MAKYVDGFVLMVPKNKIKNYQKIAKIAGKVWRDHGALEYRECVAEDMKVKVGIPFRKMTGAKPSETIFFSWIVYKSRAHRDKVNAAVMKDKRMEKMMAEAEDAFDCRRMSYGGFDVLVDMA